MALYARITFFFNLAFLLVLLLRMLESAGGFHTYRLHQEFIATLLVMHFLSFFLNAAFLLLILFRMAARKGISVARVVTIVNFIVGLAQAVYFLF